MMLKRTAALFLILILLLGILSMNVVAEEETYKVDLATQWESAVEKANNIQIPLYDNVRIASEYPNNPPAYVDTVAEKVSWIVKQCQKKGITDTWEIALWLHDWLIYNANYDYTFKNNSQEGVLMKGTGTCMSYAMAYSVLLDKFGIENTLVVSTDHMWNSVKIDGEWCNIDATWDDPGDGGSENHIYFGLSDLCRHQRKPEEIPYNPDYDDATSDINSYYVRRGMNFGFTTEQEMNDLLTKCVAERMETIEVFYLGDDPAFSFRICPQCRKRPFFCCNIHRCPRRKPCAPVLSYYNRT